MPIDQYFDKLEGVRTSDKIRFTSKSANDKGYIFLEGKSHGSYSYRDLLISCEKSHFGLNWFNAHHALHRENSFMLNIRQYVDFLSLLKIGRGFDGNGQRIDESILLKMAYDILEIKDPWQGEWLDAEFSIDRVNIYDTSQDRLRMACQHEIYPIGLYARKIYPVSRDRLKRLIPLYGEAIDLSTLDSIGLPTRTSNDVNFIGPCGGPRKPRPVAGFLSLDSTHLYCCGVGPDEAYPYIGVRRAKERKPR